MIISLNWLKKFVDIDIPVDKLVELIGSRLVEVEDVVDLGKKYQSAIIVKVVEANRIEDSDHLSLVKLDDGGTTDNIERDEQGLIQVVCGAPNMHKGLTVVWLSPGAVVPSSYNTNQPFVLGSRQIKGHISHGMVASAKELDLSDDHQGILEIKDEIEAGTSFAKAYELDDILLNIENKSLTHRPDCFGIIGFAREVAAILGKRFITPEWLETSFSKVIDKDFNLTVNIEDSAISSRYQAVVLGDIKPGLASPLDIQTYLARLAIRPINFVVDVTNYLMVLTGQPLHAFDYDKLLAITGGSANLGVRLARSDETLELLDGHQINLSKEDIIITAGDQPIALAGAMGGASTAIDSKTERIIIESASFNLYNLRSTQMRHGIFSEAITRFTKGQPARLTEPVIYQAINMLETIGGARLLSSVVEDYPDKKELTRIELTADKINQILGSNYKIEDIKQTLENIGFNCSLESAILIVEPPYWRSDINILEDIIEEVGRINGFDNIKAILPRLRSKAVVLSNFDKFRNDIRDNLVRLGANEVLLYSFVHGDLLKKAKQDPDNSYRLVNSISPDLQYYRQSLTPSLINAAYNNLKAGFDKFALFEINKVHDKSAGLDQEAVPVETESLALTIVNKGYIDGAAYYMVKQLLDRLAILAKLEIGFKPMDKQDNCSYLPFENSRSAIIYNLVTGQEIGIIGEYKRLVIKDFKLPNCSAGFELDLLALLDSQKRVGSSYRPLSKFPAIERDICFQVDSIISFSDLEKAIKSSCQEISEYNIDFKLLDIYRLEASPKKNLTFSFKVFSYEHTIDSLEAGQIIDRIGQAILSRVETEII